jgi:putative tryptophan/tyrosine transport system substrate-binding protein
VKRKITVLTLCAMLFALCGSADTQQTGKVFRIGYLDPSTASGIAVLLEAFRQELIKLGWIEGKNIAIEYRYAEGNLDRVPEFAAELVRLKVDIIIAGGPNDGLTAKKAIKTIPIVFTDSPADPVALGLVDSLARPGGNVTGATNIDPDLSAKRLELLKETFPKLSRVAVLYHGASGADQEELQETQAAARTLGVQVQSFTVQEPSQFLDTYAQMIKRRAEALIIFNSAFTGFHREQLVGLAIKNRLLTMCANAAWSDAGCLISYGPNGEQPTKF